jgi:hypothetical protein
MDDFKDLLRELALGPMSGADHDATPQPDWAALGWITHRQPTAKDADGLGEVVVPASVGAAPRTGDARCSGFRLIVPGQPWWSQYAPEPGHPTAPAEPDRIASRRVVQIAASTSLDLFALCDDGTIWINVSRSDWAELPAIPQP